MTALLGAGLAGIVAGAIHVVTGPDHLAVVAPLAARDPVTSWRTGLRWGAGHAGGVALVGAAAVGLRELLPLATLASWSERLVGLSLIVVGVWAFLALRRVRAREGASGGVAGQLGHRAGHAPGHGRAHRAGEFRAGAGLAGRAALGVGALHGTAGGAHLVGVLPALALSDRVAAGAYLLAFGLGTVAAMTVFAALVGRAGRHSLLAGPRAYAGLLGGCAAASVVVGVWWIVP